MWVGGDWSAQKEFFQKLSIRTGIPIWQTALC